MGLVQRSNVWRGAIGLNVCCAMIQPIDVIFDRIELKKKKKKETKIQANLISSH